MNPHEVEMWAVAVLVVSVCISLAAIAITGAIKIIKERE